MSTKNEAFHRLAQKRSETVCDAIRIFGNLSSNNYEWSPQEVIDYLAGIQTALDEASLRFHETKRWKAMAEVVVDSLVDTESEDEQERDEQEEGDLTGAETPHPKQTAVTAPAAHVLPEEEKLALEEMIVMQRTVISDLQRKLDAMRAPPARQLEAEPV